MKNYFLTAALAALTITSCSSNQASDNKAERTLSGLEYSKFEKTLSDTTQQSHLFTLTNSNGMEVCITNFGGRIVSIMAPDKAGKLRDVVLGFDNIDDYIDIPSDFGATIGRYANRIGGAKFNLDGLEIALHDNNNGNCLHGGPKGWQYQLFSGKQIDDNSLELSLISPDGDMNFPGNVNVKVLFTLTEDNAIDIDYTATTDKKTVINMTNHSYFNLSGNPANGNADHILYLNATTYTPVDDNFIPTGAIETVKNTPMDFTEPKTIGKDIDNTDFEQIKFGYGFDHNWILETKGDISQLAAKLSCPESGISLEVYTNEPGIQVYAGNMLDGSATGKNGITYNKRASVCLETQHFPDSPNKLQFPSVFLEPGQTYHSKCIYKFTVDK